MADRDAHLRELFQQCDTDNSGFIDAEEMITLLGKLGVPPDQATSQVPLLMRRLDNDGDGHVSFEEFQVGLQDFLGDPEEEEEEVYGGEYEEDMEDEEVAMYSQPRKKAYGRSDSNRISKKSRSEEPDEMTPEYEDHGNYEGTDGDERLAWQIFNEVASNADDGTINMEELKILCERIGIEVSSQQDLIELFQNLDDNKDGLVTFDEFLYGLRLFKDLENEQPQDQYLQDFADQGGGSAVPSGRRSVTNLSPFLTNNVAPLFPELGSDAVPIDKVLEVWEEKGLKDPTDRAVLEFLKKVDEMSKGENQILPQHLSYNIEAILTSNEYQHDSLRESAIAAFKSVITGLQSNLTQVQIDMDSLNAALSRRTEDLEKAMQEYEERLDLEHRKGNEKMRAQKESSRQAAIQLEKEQEQKVEKLNNQMDRLIKKNDKDTKNFKNEEANFKKMVSEREEDLKVTKKYLHEAQNELIKYDELQLKYKELFEEHVTLHRSNEQNKRQNHEQQENADEIRKLWQETSEENKKLSDQVDELGAKCNALKMKLDKAERTAKDNEKRLKKAQKKLQNQQEDSLVVDQRQKMRQRLSVAVPMFTKGADPNAASTIDTTLEDSLNDEIIDSESNNVLELQEEIWRLQEEIENRDFEIERYAKIIMTRMRDDDQFMKDGDTEHGPSVEITEVVDLNDSAPTVAQDEFVRLESQLKDHSSLLDEANLKINNNLSEITSLSEERDEIKKKFEEAVGQLEMVRSTEDSSEEVVTDLHEQIKLLNGTLEVNATEIESLEEQLEENYKVIGSYEDDLSEKQNLLEQCEEEFDLCKLEFSKSRDQIAGLTEQIKSIEHERVLDSEQQKYKVTELERQLEQLMEERTASSARVAELATLQDKSLVSGDLIKRLQSTVVELSRELEEAKSALSEAEEECSSLKQAVYHSDSVTKDLHAHEELNKKLSEEISQINTVLAEQLQYLEKSHQENEELKCTLEDSQKQTETLQETLEDSQKQTETLQETLKDSQKQTETLQETLINITEEHSKLSTNFENEQNVLEKDRASLKNRLETLMKEQEEGKETLMDELQYNVQRRQQVEVEKASLADELAATQNRLTEALESMEKFGVARSKETSELEHILESKENEITTLKTHIEQVENDYEQLVDSLNKETDDRVSDLQNQLEDTAAMISSLKSQLHDLGQQLVVLTSERDRYFKESVKVKNDNLRMNEERELLFSKVEELKSTRDTLEQDLEEQVAEYQDMMKCCANLQQENQKTLAQTVKDYIKELEQNTFELDEKSALLEQTEKEKEEIIQLFEDKIREKERDLERSTLEKSLLEGKARETEIELTKTKTETTCLDDVKRSLEQQLTAVIQSLDDLTERYEIENNILEEKVVETMNEVKIVEETAQVNLEEKLEEQKEKMYDEFRKEMETVKENHQRVLSSNKEETSTAIAEFKRKCEKKVKDIKENLNRELEGKEAQIRNLKIQNEADKTKFDERLNQIKESFSDERAQLLQSLSSDKDKILDRITQMTDDKVKQLEETHKKDCEIYEEKLRSLQEKSQQLSEDLNEARSLLVTTKDEHNDQMEKLKSEHRRLGESQDAAISELKETVLEKEKVLALSNHNITNLQQEVDTLIQNHDNGLADIKFKFEQEQEKLLEKHSEEVEEITEKNVAVVEDLGRRNSIERKTIMKEYNDLIESIKEEKNEEISILEKKYENEAKIMEKKNLDLLNRTSEQANLIKKKEHRIDELNDEIIKVHEDKIKTQQLFEEELVTLETEREDLVSSFREQEQQLLEEVDNIRESSFTEVENTAKDLASLSQKYDQLEQSTVDRASYDKMQHRVSVLMSTLKTEQAVSRERATQVYELLALRGGLEKQVATLKTAFEGEKSHLLEQLTVQRTQNEEAREEQVRCSTSSRRDLERRLDNVVTDHANCYAMKRKINSLKQQLAFEKTARNPNSELSQNLQIFTIQIRQLEEQVGNLEKANSKLESTVAKLVEENSDLVEKLNTTEHQIHLALQETLKTKSQKVAICKVLDNVVHTVVTAA